MGDGRRDLLEANLRRYGLSGRTVLEGDAFALRRAGALGGRRVGVYYYDAAHDYESQFEALRLVEPSLAKGTLLIIDDTDWTQVAGLPRAPAQGQTPHRARRQGSRSALVVGGRAGPPLAVAAVRLRAGHRFSAQPGGWTRAGYSRRQTAPAMTSVPG